MQANRVYENGNPIGGQDVMLMAWVEGTRTIQLFGRSNDAEGEPLLPPTRATVRARFSGELLRSRPFPHVSQDHDAAQLFFGFSAGAAGNGLWVKLWGSACDEGACADTERVAWLVSSVDAATPGLPSVRRGPRSWTRVQSDVPPTMQWGRTLRFGSRTIELETSHRRRSRHRLHANTSLVLAYSDNTGDCDVDSHFVMELVDRERGESLWHADGEDQADFRFEHGKLWMQHGDRMYVFPNPRENIRQELPSELGLSSVPDDYNPYC